MKVSRNATIPFCAGFVAMAVVAGTGLTSVPLDWDEGATLSAVTRSPVDLMRLAAFTDGVVSPYYFLISVLVKVFGQSDTVLRLPSLLAMAAGAGVTAELGRRVAGPAAGVLAGVLCPAIPSLVLFGQTARPYAIAYLVTTLASLFLLIAMRTPTWWRWGAYGLCVVFVGIAHLVALSVLAGHLMILALAIRRERDRRLWRAVAVLGAALVALTPLLLLGRNQRSLQLHWVPVPGWSSIITLPGDIAHSVPAGLLLLVLAVAAYAALPARRYVELSALVVMPIVVIVAVSQIAPVWVPRYGIFLLAPLAVMAAATATSPRLGPVEWSPRFVPALATVTAMLLAGLAGQINVRTSHNSGDTRAMAATIHDNAIAGDVIVYTELGWSMRPTLGHYLRELDWSRTPQPADVLLKRTAARNGNLEVTEFEDLAVRLRPVRRIWLIGPIAGLFATPEDPLTSPGGKFGYLRQHYQVGRAYVFQNGRAVLLVVRNQPPPAAP